MLLQRLSVVCLGTGKGASMVYEGDCSSSYVLCVDSQPLVLFGVGYGVTRQCVRYFGEIPPYVFVFSNRSHMAAEIPVLVAVESHRGNRIRLLGEDEVLRRIRVHRLAEVHDLMVQQGRQLDQLCELVPLCAVDSPRGHHRQGDGETWPPTGAGGTAAVPAFVIPTQREVSLQAFRTTTTEMSAGVHVLLHGNCVLTITGDCAFDPNVYRCHVLGVSPVAIVDGRERSSSDHASFDEIHEIWDAWRCRRPAGDPNLLLIGQYGQISEAPRARDGDQSRLPLVEGSVTHLDPRRVPRIVLLAAASTYAPPRSTEGPQHIGALDEGGAGAASAVDVAAPELRVARDPLWHRDGASVSAERDAGDPERVATISRSPGMNPSAHGALRGRGRSVEDCSKVANGTNPPMLTKYKRVYLVDFENPSREPRLMMVHTLRTVQQLKQRASELLGVRPVGDLFEIPKGDVVRSLEQLHHDATLAVTKQGGRRYPTRAIRPTAVPAEPSEPQAPILVGGGPSLLETAPTVDTEGYLASAIRALEVSVLANGAPAVAAAAPSGVGPAAAATVRSQLEPRRDAHVDIGTTGTSLTTATPAPPAVSLQSAPSQPPVTAPVPDVSTASTRGRESRYRFSTIAV